jgi:hypothetical protein
LAAGPLNAQVIATAEGWPGVQIHFEAKLEPPPPPSTNPAILKQLEKDVSGGVICDSLVHRFWKDEEQKAYEGYDVMVEPGRGAGTYQIRVSPLSLTPKKMAEFGLPENWTRLSLPKYPVIPEVHAGDTVALDLLVNRATGQKMVDYLTLERTGPGGRTAPRPAPAIAPRDFTLADAGLTLYELRIYIDGNLVEATSQPVGGIQGADVWFYLKGRGQYVLSLIPDHRNLRLRRSGEIIGNTVTFRYDATDFRIECSRPVTPSSGTFNVYVFHDSNWRPRGRDANAPYILGSGPLVELDK